MDETFTVDRESQTAFEYHGLVELELRGLVIGGHRVLVRVRGGRDGVTVVKLSLEEVGHE